MAEGVRAVRGAAEDMVTFHGHPSVAAKHRSTLEVTKNPRLTRKGDCVIGVAADKACADLKGALKAVLLDDDAKVKIRILVGHHIFELSAAGDHRLSLEHTTDIVVRKSNFVCSRTLAVRSDKAAVDMPRAMVRMLRDPRTEGIMVISAAR